MDDEYREFTATLSFVNTVAKITIPKEIVDLLNLVDNDILILKVRKTGKKKD